MQPQKDTTNTATTAKELQVSSLQCNKLALHLLSPLSTGKTVPTRSQLGECQHHSNEQHLHSDMCLLQTGQERQQLHRKRAAEGLTTHNKPIRLHEAKLTPQRTHMYWHELSPEKHPEGQDQANERYAY